MLGAVTFSFSDAFEVEMGNRPSGERENDEPSNEPLVSSLGEIYAATRAVFGVGANGVFATGAFSEFH